MSKKQFTTLLKQGSYSSTGILLSRILTVISSIILARSIGPASFGIYASLWALLQISLAFSENGMTTGIKRDGARDHKLLPVLLGNTLLFKAVIGIVVLAVVILFYSQFSETNSADQLILPLVIITYLLLFVEPFFTVMRVKGKQKIIAGLQTGKSFLLLAGFSALAFIKVDLVVFMWFQAVLNCVFVLVVYYVSSSFVRVKYDLSTIIQQFSGAFIFGVTGILFTIYTQIPILALMCFASSKEVGYFAVAYKFVELIFIVASAACNNAFLPYLFKLYKSNKKDFSVICNRMQIIFTSLGIVAATSLYVYGEPLIIILQGEEYRPAIKSLHIMSWSVMLSMSGLSPGVSIIASDKMRILTVFKLFVTAIVFIAGIVIIKPYGFLGASYTICILWGALFLFYFSYAGYKRFIDPAVIFPLVVPAGLSIMSALGVMYSPLSLPMGIFLFFFSMIVIWLLTYIYMKKNQITKCCSDLN